MPSPAAASAACSLRSSGNLSDVVAMPSSTAAFEGITSVTPNLTNYRECVNARQALDTRMTSFTCSNFRHGRYERKK
jgi:hypothetical protein